MNKRASSLFAVFVGLILLVANCEAPEHDSAALPSGASTTSPETADLPGESASPPDPTGATHRVIDIVRSPEKLIGKSVTIIADVGEVYGGRAFNLREAPLSSRDSGPESPENSRSEKSPDSLKSPDIPGNLGEGLLTLIPKVGSFPTADTTWSGARARVTGVVQELAVKDIEREIGWELGPDLTAKFKGKPVLIARSVERFKK